MEMGRRPRETVAPTTKELRDCIMTKILKQNLQSREGSIELNIMGDNFIWDGRI